MDMDDQFFSRNANPKGKNLNDRHTFFTVQ